MKQANPSSESLIANLLAASLTIGGKNPQEVNFVNPKIEFQWSISTDLVASHSVTITLYKITESIESKLDEIKKTINVVNLFGLSRKMVWIITIITSVLALPVTAIAIYEASEKILNLFGCTFFVQ